jgi:Domain of unknown function (DUF4268)
MSKHKIGKLERVPLREVWKHEALDFTQWLQENIDVLNTALDLNLVNVDREQAAGSFSIDLVAEDGSGGTVVIENQLEKSNHDHLGKLVTYLTAMGATVAIWIVSDPRPEHVAAITWLNESSSASFYMVKVEAVKIGDSPAAPLLTLIVGPSEEAQTIGLAKKEIAERHEIRRRWWTELIERSRTVNNLHSHITPGKYAWIGTSSGTRGIGFNYTVLKDECGAEVYIDRGKGADEENEKIFDQLYANKTEIENAFGAPLKWERLESKRACRIKHTNSEGGYRSPEEKWVDIQTNTIKAMDRLEKAFSPYLARLHI